ncbi:MAG: hypothetical protein KH897_16765 [Bacteroides sp.]|uniref:hypothetical protein n=1 Tax=Bacteroides sp. TaxID=29523 RepID=UPI0025BC09F3|nr:hypothetical protein [Bacteroides sp.]MBS6239973.1 hypothetical protein [Bacteroides sp.]
MMIAWIKVKGGIYFFLWAICLCSCSLKMKQCHEDKRVQEVKYWLGKQIYFPNANIDTLYLDTVYEDCNKLLDSVDYKLLVYVDSFACTSCNLDLYLWNELISNASIDIPNKVLFFFYCQPKYQDEKKLQYLIKRDKFDMPLLVDSANQIGYLNGFLNHFHFQCFLLGESNRILAIGDPTQSLKMWEYYKSIISEDL